MSADPDVVFNSNGCTRQALFPYRTIQGQEGVIICRYDDKWADHHVIAYGNTCRASDLIEAADTYPVARYKIPRLPDVSVLANPDPPRSNEKGTISDEANQSADTPRQPSKRDLPPAPQLRDAKGHEARCGQRFSSEGKSTDAHSVISNYAQNQNCSVVIWEWERNLWA